jgi:diguanylate cyclase (GGDEF)-like protein
MVATELNLVAFFSMYMGFRWFVLREPLRSKRGPVALLAVMVVYCGMFLLDVPYAYQVGSLPTLWMCGAVIGLMLRQNEERFRIPARIAMALLLAHMGLVIYRMTLPVEMHQRVLDLVHPTTDPRWTYSTLFIIVLSNCLLIMYVWFTAAEMYSTVEATAGMDALTGCVNRRALMKLAGHEVERSERTGMPLAIVALDLDYFKHVNDTYGHGAGDATLCSLVSLLMARLRSVDVVARTGGEEFLLLLPDTDAIAASVVVKELLVAVEHMRVAHDGSVIRVTMSAGITQRLLRVDTWTAMMNRADHALYGAKAAGRNCLVLDEQVMNLPQRPVPVRKDVVSISGVSEASAIRMKWTKQG